MTGTAQFIWAIEPTVGVYVFDADFPTAGVWGAEFRTAVGDAAPETDPRRLRGPARVGRGRDRRSGAVRGHADARRCRRRRRRRSRPTTSRSTPSTRRRSPTRWPRRSRSSWPSRRRSSARPRNAGRRSTGSSRSPRRIPDVTFINVEPYQLQLVDGQLQPVLTGDAADLTPAAATDAWRLLSEPWVFVVDRDGIVTVVADADLQRRGARGGRRRGRVARVGGGSTYASVTAQPPASSSRTAKRSSPSIRYQTRTGAAVAWCSARWPGGNSVAFSSSPRRNASVSPPATRSVKPRTSVRPGAVDRDDHALDRGHVRGSVRVEHRGVAQQRAPHRP